MPKDDKPDLIRDPIDLAVKLSQEQVEKMVAEFQRGGMKPTTQFLHDRGITLKDILNPPER